MNITLNGKAHTVPGGSVADLVASLKVKSVQVAVALNGEVVRRTDWAETALSEGDAVEIVRAVGGG